jgi:DNA-binding CsgD family transcriptional regulator
VGSVESAEHGRVLVLGRHLLTAQALAVAIGPHAVGASVPDAPSRLPSGDVRFAVVVVDVEPLSRGLAELLAMRCPYAVVVHLVSDRAFAEDSGAEGIEVLAVLRSAGLDVVRDHVHALVAGPGVHRSGAAGTRDRVGLTAREHQVADFVTTGWSNSQIAGELGVSVHTVRSHVQRILLKLGVSNRFAAADVLRQATGSPVPGSEGRVSLLVEDSAS